LETKAERAILAEFGREAVYSAELEQRQYLKQLEDMLTDITIAIDSALDTCSILECKHQEFEENTSSGVESPSSEMISQVLAEKKRELRHHRSQAEQMLMRARSAEALVILECLSQVLY
jgi:hypothetical protein